MTLDYLKRQIERLSEDYQIEETNDGWVIDFDIYDNVTVKPTKSSSLFSPAWLRNSTTTTSCVFGKDDHVTEYCIRVPSGDYVNVSHKGVNPKVYGNITWGDKVVHYRQRFVQIDTQDFAEFLTDLINNYDTE